MKSYISQELWIFFKIAVLYPTAVGIVLYAITYPFLHDNVSIIAFIVGNMIVFSLNHLMKIIRAGEKVVYHCIIGKFPIILIRRHITLIIVIVLLIMYQCKFI